MTQNHDTKAGCGKRTFYLILFIFSACEALWKWVCCADDKKKDDGMYEYT